MVSATGASTVTVAFGGSHSDDELMAQEYSAGAGATWSAGANGSTSSTTSTVTFPSLTPSGSGELYLGFAQVDGSGEAGSTPGFSYTITSAEGSVLCWDTNVSSATSPTATQTGSGSDSVGALLVASGGGGGTTTTGVTTTTTAPTTTTTTASGSGPVTTYMIELTGGVLLEVTGSTQAWYYPNLQGGTAAEASSAGAAVGGVTLYDPFGNTLSALQADSPDNLAFGYEGKHGIGTETDGANTVVLMGARLYNPATGRFLQMDPLPAGSANAYDYVDQDPLNGSDLSGTCFLGKSGGPFDIFGGKCLSKVQKIHNSLEQSLRVAEGHATTDARIISSINTALDCLVGVGGDDVVGIGTCLATGSASSIVNEINGEVRMGVSFALDPLGATLGMLIDVFSCVAGTAINVANGMNHPVVVHTGDACDQGIVILPTNGEG